ncbi:MAG: tRNA 5-methoxyuridine(34)/uridine 5-oxyacetic acid(34) synthase CmoB [Desulfuromonas sp.]|nr:MAG: tRNA 5-methoxyuridine(34)/uridine 5-oxyacetic acid(34) synthase CmoB [Desulfuromonas sp.]
MSLYDPLYRQLETMGLTRWSEQLQSSLPGLLNPARNRDLIRWQEALQELPQVHPSSVELKQRLEIGRAGDLGDVDRDGFISLLKTFHPWRKGPISLFGVEIDTEWRSDWKWDRLLPHIRPLAGRTVLDVGCGNGYHGWRMLGEGADFVLGIDPTLVFVMQHRVIQHYLASERHQLLPLRLEDVPPNLNGFDTVFSMGVLYHRRSPLDHLLALRGCLQPGGELVLETLIVEGDETTVFMPEDRYAKMRNVWFLPSVAVMKLWLQRCGFVDIACVDINRTSTEEQRRTEWMTDESLADYLDPYDPTRTIEGHPAPTRAIFTATRP